MDPIPSSSSSLHVASAPDDGYDRANSPSSSIFTLPETLVPRPAIVSKQKADRTLGKHTPCISATDVTHAQLAEPESERDTSCRTVQPVVSFADSEDDGRKEGIDDEGAVSDHEGEGKGKGRSKKSILAPVGRLLRAFRRRKTTSILRSGKEVALSSPRPARIKSSFGHSVRRRASSASVAGPSKLPSGPSTPEASRSTFPSGMRQSPKSGRSLRRTSTMSSRRSVGSTKSRESARRHVYGARRHLLSQKQALQEIEPTEIVDLSATESIVEKDWTLIGRSDASPVGP